MSEKKETLSFETAFARLEEILEKMNSSTLPLDEALKLYEEADKLIQVCNSQLSQAERKIEMLLKNRNGDLQLGANGKPQTQDFEEEK